MDLKHIKYYQEIKRFEYSIEILNLINIINRSNKLCKDIGSEMEISTEILYTAIDAILKEKPFSDKQLRRYYQLMQDFEVFVSASIPISNMHNDFDLLYEIDYSLLGMTYKEQLILNKDHINQLHEDFGDILCDNRHKDLEMDSFISQAKKLITDAKKGC